MSGIRMVSLCILVEKSRFSRFEKKVMLEKFWCTEVKKTSSVFFQERPGEDG